MHFFVSVKICLAYESSITGGADLAESTLAAYSEVSLYPLMSTLLQLLEVLVASILSTDLCSLVQHHFISFSCYLLCMDNTIKIYLLFIIIQTTVFTIQQYFYFKAELYSLNLSSAYLQHFYPAIFSCITVGMVQKIYYRAEY